MARVTAVWGIDVGHCALKALRCHIDDKNPDKIVADAFDYIEYPQITTQAEADPVELVRNALTTFLERNELRGTKIAVSVSGQSGLARFIKLPPVETKKIPDIVRYEANQQIPFDLEDVIWDYQRMFGGGEEDGLALETEVGLFAMKREQVYEEIEAFRDANIDVDIVQLSPLAIYNFLIFDQIGELSPEDEFDPDDPPESMIGLSIGTETTDLVITNGFRVWQRSVPLGGSHFTKALVKELQQTYAAAEELKRHATESDDPKAIYQAMRPVFKDLLTEIQRSIGYFQSLDRAAKVGRILAMGNSMELPGLKRYLSQNLGQDVEEVESMTHLTGSAVISAPEFKNNILSFPVSYGLAIQALGVGRLNTNLVPLELVRDRTINRKKPWAVAASVLLTLGCLLNFMILWWPWSQVRIDVDEPWKAAAQKVGQVDNEIKQNENLFNAAQDKYKKTLTFGKTIVSHYDHQTDWLNLASAIATCLPDDPEDAELADLTESEKIWLTDVTVRHEKNLGSWYTPDITAKFQLNSQPVELPKIVNPEDLERREAWKGILNQKQLAEEQKINENQLPALKPRFPSHGKPDGKGYIVQLTGYHFHDSRKHASADHFVRRTLVHNLQDQL
ncbi:MAG TPA: pilus assembly protein PilM, partial [Pirellulales bacterium]|nr:pilus assembly protein PilM [Pirellulales bacterium]